MNVLDAVRTRRAVRVFSEKKIEKEKLNRILEAGRLAPSASNEQRTKCIVVDSPQIIAQLAKACMGQKSVKTASVVLVICADGDRKMQCGQSARTMDCAIAASFMRLEAVEQGLQGCWLGLYKENKVREILSIPEEYIIAAVLPIGYPLNDGEQTEKKALEEFVIYNKWEEIN